MASIGDSGFGTHSSRLASASDPQVGSVDADRCRIDDSDMGSVTGWIHDIQAGDRVRSPMFIFRRYCDRLSRLAQSVLKDCPQAGADSEDVVLEAMSRFFEAAYRDRFPELHDRDNLWALLVQITIRVSLNQRRREMRRRRGVPERSDGSRSVQTGHADAVADPAPPPDLWLAATEQCEMLLGRLQPETRAIAVLKLQHLSHREIAIQMDVSERTVERRVQMIRECWSEMSRREG